MTWVRANHFRIQEAERHVLMVEGCIAARRAARTDYESINQSTRDNELVSPTVDLGYSKYRGVKLPGGSLIKPLALVTGKED